MPGAEAALPANRCGHELMATDLAGHPSAQMWPAPGTSMVMSYGDQFTDSSPVVYVENIFILKIYNYIENIQLY